RAREKKNEFTLEIQNLIKTNSQLRKSSNILSPNCREIAQQKRRAQERAT
ncbi:28517_t:CDS:1, partial [Dentiscutata erythropus]